MSKIAKTASKAVKVAPKAVRGFNGPACGYCKAKTRPDGAGRPKRHVCERGHRLFRKMG